MPFLFQIFTGTLYNSFAQLFATIVSIPATLMLDLINMGLQAIFGVPATGTPTGTTGS